MKVKVGIQIHFFGFFTFLILVALWFGNPQLNKFDFEILYSISVFVLALIFGVFFRIRNTFIRYIIFFWILGLIILNAWDIVDERVTDPLFASLKFLVGFFALTGFVSEWLFEFQND